MHKLFKSKHVKYSDWKQDCKWSVALMKAYISVGGVSAALKISFQAKEEAVNLTFLSYVTFVWTDYVLHPHTFWKVRSFISNTNSCGTKKTKKKVLSLKCIDATLAALYKHQNDDEFEFNSALNHKVAEDSLCCLFCLAPSGSCPISLHQTRQTESEKWRSPACANINPKFPASIPSWPWFGMTSICWLAAHISLQIVWARLICFYARLVKNVMPR